MTIRTTKELVADAEILATSFRYINYKGRLYIPTDYETGDDSVTPAAERTMWMPLGPVELQVKTKDQFGTVFVSPRQRDDFYYMVSQCSTPHVSTVDSLLIRTEEGLRRLGPDGKLHMPDGEFVPNTLRPMLNTDRHDRRHVFEVIANWLDSEVEATSLLHHLSTALAPHWSSVKYLLFLGAGRNGKSLLMTMLVNLFGRENCSMISRQDIADNSPALTDVNGKLLNVVFDGMAAYLKDSGKEKSLIAGEAVAVRRLYTSTMVDAQTNALFIEGLNQEPKSLDKSTALQARLVRFGFPNVYADDLLFAQEMQSEKNLGALLNLLIEHYVLPEERVTKLAPTIGSIALQLEHMEMNSPALQFVKYQYDNAPLGADGLIGLELAQLASEYNAWRLKVLNDIDVWTEPDVARAFAPVVQFARRSKRINGRVDKVKTVVGFAKETLDFLNSFKADIEEDAHDTAVVED